MKKLMILLLLTSHLILAQNNVALLHIEMPAISPISTALENFSETTFELAGGMVIVEATLDGEPGNFILDTGSPGIVLNSKRDEDFEAQTAAGIGGQVSVGAIEIRNFEWGIIQKEKIRGYLLDVSHLEKSCGRDIMGLIGYDILKNYELFFDYRNRIVKVFKAGQVKSIAQLSLVKSIPFRLYGHVPVVSAKVGGKRVLLGLDSGAEVNLLDDKFFEPLSESSLTDIEHEFLTGLDRQRREVIAADVRTTQVKGQSLPEMRFVFTDLKPLREQFGVTIDGLLGFPFFKDQIISINYRKKKIYIWK